MRECCVCHGFLVPCNEGADHIGFEPDALKRVVFICQGCLDVPTPLFIFH
jgi:hypothetical protein